MSVLPREQTATYTSVHHFHCVDSLTFKALIRTTSGKEGRKEGTPRLRSPREHGMGAPDNMPVEQTGRKTVYTKSGRKVQAPQRLDL